MQNFQKFVNKEEKTMNKIHYFGSGINDDFHYHWYRFRTECGIHIEREVAGARMKHLTNRKKRVTCKNCIKLMENN